MRTNTFGEPIFEPGDDFFANWSMKFGDDPEGEIARFLEEDDGAWGCEIADNNDHSGYASGFATKEDLVAWLEKSGVEIED